MQLRFDELAKCLDVTSATLDRWIRQGRIPVRRKADVCEFSPPLMEKWAEANHMKFVMPGAEDDSEKNPREEKLDDLNTVFRRGGVFYDIEGESIDEVLWSAVQRMPFFETPEQKKSLYESLKEREDMKSTGIGNGVAIPHPRTPFNDSGNPAVVAACFLKHPIDYQAIDKKPVFVLFVLVSYSAKQHLHLLAQLSYCLRNNSFVQMLKDVPDPETLYQRVDECVGRMESSA